MSGAASEPGLSVWLLTPNTSHGGGGLTSSPFGGAVACSRLLDSRDDA